MLGIKSLETLILKRNCFSQIDQNKKEENIEMEGRRTMVL